MGTRLSTRGEPKRLLRGGDTSSAILSVASGCRRCHSRLSSAVLMPVPARPLAWHALQRVIIRSQGSDGVLARAIGHDVKGKVSPVLYAAGILLAFIDARIACAVYLLVVADVAHPRPAERKGGRALLIARALRA